MQRGSYRPERDATPWVEFCVDAHIVQARRRLDQIERAAARGNHLERLMAERGWPERLAIALEQSLSGRTDRARYVGEAHSTAYVAAAHFRETVGKAERPA